MKMRFKIFALALFIGQLCFANMASPLRPGTQTATPFISENVDIISENILIIPDEKFQTAKFQIEYHIQSSKSGSQIPLLFYAVDFREDFRIWIDDEEIRLSPIPEQYFEIHGTPFNDFSYLFSKPSWSDDEKTHANRSLFEGFYVTTNDLKFFQTALSEGEHIIKVEYLADVWVDHNDWVKKYSFRYLLSPAQLWKSFGNLTITIDSKNLAHGYTTNLGEHSSKIHSKSTWIFSAIPTDVLKIEYQPEINPIATMLITLSPFGMTIIIGVLFLLLHLLLMKLYRNKRPNHRFSWPVIIGSIVFPFLTLLGFTFSFNVIDAYIGNHASQYHGYTFLVFFIYPVITPIYWIAMWLIDQSFKEYINKKRS